MGYVPDLEWDFCSFSYQNSDHYGLSFQATTLKPSLSGYDMIFLPGGYGTRLLQTDRSFISWLQTASEVPLKVSVCTGSLLLGAAGFLRTKKATTHFAELHTLQQYCREVSTERIVADGDVVTAGAVSSSIDLGLYLCSKWVSEQAASEVAKRMAYERIDNLNLHHGTR